jgi:hypothetical protein
VYRIGRGEEGVLSTEPYTSELVALWRFRTPEEARASAAALLERYRAYRDGGDFAGMDMARKFLQMGVTRSRRYARHRSGRKYGPDGLELPLDPDPVKEESARVFDAAWREVRTDPAYLEAKERHKALARAAKARPPGAASPRPKSRR